MTGARYRISRRAAVASLGAAALTACAPRTRTGKDADVIIVGGGLSGLFAAIWLVDAGYRVKALEATDRAGGRMMTLRELPGAPEAGGSEVGQTYARIRYAAERFGVPIIDNAPRARTESLIAVGDRVMRGAEWASWNGNPMPEQFRAVPPGAALFAAAGPANSFEWAGDWRTAAAFAKDQSADAYLAGLGFSAEARRLVDASLNANAIDAYSMLNVWRTLHLFGQDSGIGPSGRLDGGAQRLPEVMAASLGEDFIPNFRAASIAHDANGVAVSDGARTLRADFCIVALPFPALANIAVDPAPTGAQAAAIAALPYTQIVQLHLEAAPFWEDDGLPPVMWTDGALERVFATKDRETDDIVGLLAWINGEPARRLGAMDDDALETLAQDELRRLRPASQGKVKLRKAVRWTSGTSYAGGAYMHWAPGQAQGWAEVMGAPLGRVHFAGEHLSYLHTGMEGAMEAGQNAADAVIEASA